MLQLLCIAHVVFQNIVIHTYTHYHSHTLDAPDTQSSRRWWLRSNKSVQVTLQVTGKIRARPQKTALSKSPPCPTMARTHLLRANRQEAAQRRRARPRLQYQNLTRSRERNQQALMKSRRNQTTISHQCIRAKRKAKVLLLLLTRTPTRKRPAK